MKSFEKLEILKAAVCVCGSDGEVTVTERNMIDKLNEKIGVGQASLNAMIERAKSDPDYHTQLFRVLKTEPNETMLTLFQAAMADGQIAEDELRVLKTFAAKLDIEDSAFESLVGQARNVIDLPSNE